MKKILFICFLVTSLCATAQTTKLSALSGAEFLSSKIIYDDNGKDVYGYFLLYQKDKKSKGVYELEYVLLDKNLNKLGSGDFTQQRATSTFFTFTPALLFTQKKGDMLYVSIGDVTEGYENMYNFFGLYAMRSLSLKDYKISEVSYMRNFAADHGEFTISQRKDIDQYQFMKPTKNNGFIVFEESIEAITARLFLGRKNAKNIRRFRFYDLDLNEKWSYEYKETSKKAFYEYSYLTGDGNDMVLLKEFYEKAGDRHSDISYEFFDSQTGKKKYEITLNDKKNILRLKDLKFEGDKIIIYAATNDFNANDEFSKEKITGYAKITCDRNTGKELDRNYFKWAQLTGKLDVDVLGKVKSYGYISFLDFNRTADGKTVVIGEGWERRTNYVFILDLFTFVFDDKMQLTDYHKVDKVKNSAYFNDFDYMYSQKLSGDDYVFYYADNEKKSTKKPAWVLGIITYAEGVFDFKKITLNTKKGQIYPYKAKNGYILLREENSKDSELRLEKINY